MPQSNSFCPSKLCFEFSLLDIQNMPPGNQANTNLSEAYTHAWTAGWGVWSEAFWSVVGVKVHVHHRELYVWDIQTLDLKWEWTLVPFNLFNIKETMLLPLFRAAVRDISVTGKRRISTTTTAAIQQGFGKVSWIWRSQPSGYRWLM